jgi:hypothetical protein
VVEVNASDRQALAERLLQRRRNRQRQGEGAIRLGLGLALQAAGGLVVAAEDLELAQAGLVPALFPLGRGDLVFLEQVALPGELASAEADPRQVALQLRLDVGQLPLQQVEPPFLAGELCAKAGGLSRR